MTETKYSLRDEMMALRSAIDQAHDRANREALLEHARMGQSISTWRDGKVVWIPPAEIFARYGLDEFGRPLPADPQPPK